MAYQKIYNRIGYKNFPSEDTPLNETNLGAMDNATDELDNRIVALDIAKLDKTEASELVEEILWDESNGTLTVVKMNGSKAVIDTKLEKLAVNFSYDPENQQLVITLDDGTVQNVDLSALITQYEFLEGDEIAFEITSDGKVKPMIKDGSITENKLQPNFLADIKVEAAKAEKAAEASSNSSDNSASSADTAKNYATKAKTYADTIRGIAEVGIATAEKVGLVRPDGDSLVIDVDGTMHSSTQLTNSNTIGAKGTYALDATEKNPLIDGTLAADIKVLQEQNGALDNMVIFEEVEGDDDKLLDSLMEQLLVQNITITSDSNQTLKFMYGDTLIGSIVLQGLVLNTIPCTKLSLNKENESISIYSINDLILVPSVEPLDCTEPVKWFSSNERIATVSDGIVHRVVKTDGECTIYAKCGNHTGMCKVTYIKPKFTFEIANLNDMGETISDEGKGLWIASNKLELPKGTTIKFGNSAYAWIMYEWDKTGKFVAQLPDGQWKIGGDYVLTDDVYIRIRMRTSAWTAFTAENVSQAQNSITIIDA